MRSLWNTETLVMEQENVKRVQLAETYLSQAALGDGFSLFSPKNLLEREG
jgi:hypothetical protein